VGTHVSKGETLASLDLAALSAARAGAIANLKAQQAKLADMQAGARSVDVAAKQTALDTANAALTNLYASINSNIAQPYDKSFRGISADTDTLFSQPNTSFPTLNFQSNNNQVATDAVNGRVKANSELSTWKSETTSQSANPSDVENDLSRALAHLALLRT